MKHRIDTLNYFQLFVKNAADNGLNILLSSEELNHPELNMAELTSYLVPEYKIHVVLYYRRFYDWIYSVHKQVAKTFDLRPFVEWLTQEMFDVFEPLYSLAVYKRYQMVPGVFNVSVVNMHEDPDNFHTSRTFA